MIYLSSKQSAWMGLAASAAGGLLIYAGFTEYAGLPGLTTELAGGAISGAGLGLLVFAGTEKIVDAIKKYQKG
jgi:hypothetical protein